MVDTINREYWRLKGHYPRVRKKFDIVDNLAQRKTNPKATPYCTCHLDGDCHRSAFIFTATVVKHFDYAILSHLSERDDAQLDEI